MRQPAERHAHTQSLLLLLRDANSSPRTRHHARLALRPNVADGGQAKGQRLAAAGGGNANQVAPAQRDGQALRLDGRGLLEAARRVQLVRGQACGVQGGRRMWGARARRCVRRDAGLAAKPCGGALHSARLPASPDCAKEVMGFSAQPSTLVLRSLCQAATSSAGMAATSAASVYSALTSAGRLAASPRSPTAAMPEGSSCVVAAAAPLLPFFFCFFLAGGCCCCCAGVGAASAAPCLRFFLLASAVASPPSLPLPPSSVAWLAARLSAFDFFFSSLSSAAPAASRSPVDCTFFSFFICLRTALCSAAGSDSGMAIVAGWLWGKGNAGQDRRCVTVAEQQRRRRPSLAADG